MSNNNTLSTSDLLKQEIYPHIDILTVFSELQPRKGTHNYSCTCPSCGQKRAYISINKKGGFPQVACNRKSSCGYYKNIWDYVKENGSLSNQETLQELARLAGYDLDNNKRDTTSNNNTNGATLDRTLSQANNTNTVDYVEFKEDKEFKKIAISKWLPKYDSLPITSRLKMVYTFVYQYSLQTKQDKKYEYYASRAIDTKNNYLNQIGYLTPNDVKKLEKTLMDLFPINDLLEFGVMKIKMKNEQELFDRNGNPVYVFKQYCFKGFCVIPNFDLYSNTVTGLKFRNIELADWQPKSMKEPEMSRRDIVYPFPYALNRDMLLDKNACIFLVEGHVDGLSLPVTYSKSGQAKIDYEKCTTYFVASPGINGISEEFLGLLKGKFICLCFDQDEAGRKGAYGAINISYGEEKATFVNDFNGQQAANKLISELEANGIPFYKSVLRGMAEKLTQAGARVYVKHWDINLGGDINELRQNGNLEKVFNI